ncbi:hypothetical protein B0H34DRAFT_720838 [Crassisporium funariophilum]|nr:hypothetical protein B0H34DRAFT_720838 [Crassisporium funariophilum]
MTYLQTPSIRFVETANYHNPAISHSSVGNATRLNIINVVDLAYRISHLSTFLSAAQDILQHAAAYECDFISDSKKIIRLVELARKTLENSGIVVYLFASCPKVSLPHKMAYIELLKMLQTQKPTVDSVLQERLRVLLMPLTSTLSVQNQSSSSKPTLHLRPGTSRDCDLSLSSVHASQSTSPTPSLLATQPSCSGDAMLPPNAFSPNEKCQASRRRLWDAKDIPGSLKRGRTQSPYSRQRGRENQSPENLVASEPVDVEYRPVPFSRKFGIFCTNKGSMQNTVSGRNRVVSRPTSARSVVNPRE